MLRDLDLQARGMDVQRAGELTQNRDTFKAAPQNGHDLDEVSGGRRVNPVKRHDTDILETVLFQKSGQ